MEFRQWEILMEAVNRTEAKIDFMIEKLNLVPKKPVKFKR